MVMAYGVVILDGVLGTVLGREEGVGFNGHNLKRI